MSAILCDRTPKSKKRRVQKDKPPTKRELRADALDAQGTPTSRAAAYAERNIKHVPYEPYTLDCPTCGTQLIQDRRRDLVMVYLYHDAEHRPPALLDDRGTFNGLKPYNDEGASQ